MFSAFSFLLCLVLWDLMSKNLHCLHRDTQCDESEMKSFARTTDLYSQVMEQLGSYKEDDKAYIGICTVFVCRKFI